VTGCDAYLVTVLLVVLAVGFAFAIGAHYTGACMGRPHALGAVSAWQALNQALVGAMAGAGLARGKHAVHAASLYGILRGWLIGPGAGITAGFLLALADKAASAVLLAQA
jgi:PiT family inorganic phosphate transporter